MLRQAIGLPLEARMERAFVNTKPRNRRWILAAAENSTSRSAWSRMLDRCLVVHGATLERGLTLILVENACEKLSVLKLGGALNFASKLVELGCSCFVEHALASTTRRRPRHAYGYHRRRGATRARAPDGHHATGGCCSWRVWELPAT